ncbi:MAG TPA: hypothetical protein DEP53_17905 [Bacteroidetes bacterium]|nr:hypothetical protein [Bacteroidota bacterium]
MKKILVAVNLLVLIVLAYYAYYLATDFQTPHGRRDMPFFIWVIDTIDLFIHEGGHGIFKLFGQFIYFLGGSLMQVILPVTAIVVLLRTSGPRTLLATLFWLGQNLIDVAVYIDDAPKQQLTLISRYAMHDWLWLCGYMGNLDSAGDIAAVVSFLGTLSLLGAIGFGAYYIVVDVRDEFLPSMAPKPLPPRPGLRPKAPTQPEQLNTSDTDDAL